MSVSEQKKFRDRANRARRGLLKEKEDFGYINDGSGKRYRAAVYYVLAGENDKALEFYSWYENEFPDDIGEPVFDLYWALAEKRLGNEKEANYRLQVAMISNIYMLPYLFKEPINIWMFGIIQIAQPQTICMKLKSFLMSLRRKNSSG